MQILSEFSARLSNSAKSVDDSRSKSLDLMCYENHLSVSVETKLISNLAMESELICHENDDVAKDSKDEPMPVSTVGISEQKPLEGQIHPEICHPSPFGNDYEFHSPKQSLTLNAGDDSDFQSPEPEQQIVVAVDMEANEGALVHNSVTKEFSLKGVLSDIISGSLMEDAMVTQCGHSFGGTGLQRVIDTKSCLSCGSSVASGSLIPNYALRATILAYKQENIRRKPKSSAVFPESNEKKTSQAPVQASESNLQRSKGVQFPYVSNDRVIIKGNKRTPERFVGREAVITTQCLNGWYLVQTIDTGERLRLQYRSLQKVGDDAVIGIASDSNGHSSRPTSPSGSARERTPRSDSLNKPGRGQRRGKVNGYSPSNSSEQLKGEQVKKALKRQVHEKSAEQTGHTDDSADEDLRATKRIATIGSVGIVVEGSVFRMGSSPQENKPAEGCTADTKTSKKTGADSSGEKPRTSGSHKARNTGKVAKVRSKQNLLQAKSDHLENDPYKKVYVSGCHRRGTGTSPKATRPTKSASISVNTKSGKNNTLLSSEQHQDTETRIVADSQYLQGSVQTSELIKKGMLELEKKIPWSCMSNHWKTYQQSWLKMLHESNTIKDVAKRLHELRKAVLLERAGGISEEEWTEKLEAALVTGTTDAIEHLWERLNTDVSKWIESKLQRDAKCPINVKNDFLDAKKIEQMFPDLRFGGMSRIGIIAAASLVAAEAFSDGESDMEALLAVPMKLVHDYDVQDLQELRDSIDREKRHILARIAQLEYCSPQHVLVDNPANVSILSSGEHVIYDKFIEQVKP